MCQFDFYKAFVYQISKKKYQNSSENKSGFFGTGINPGGIEKNVAKESRSSCQMI